MTSCVCVPCPWSVSAGDGGDVIPRAVTSPRTAPAPSTGQPSDQGAWGLVDGQDKVLQWEHSTPWGHRQSRLRDVWGDTCGDDGGIGDGISEEIGETSGGANDD